MNWILKGGTIVSIAGKKLLHDQDVMIREGKIIRTGSSIEADEVKILDCSGKYVLPGLFDMHIHIAIEDVLPLFILGGVTSVRNMWGSAKHLELARKIERNEVIGPNIFTVSPLYDFQDKEHDGRCLMLSKEDAKAAVDDVVKKGYVFLKTYAGIDRDVFLYLMEYAGSQGVRVVGHGNKNVSAGELAESGYYSIEHLHCLPVDEADIKVLAESGIWFCPTYVVEQMTRDYVFDRMDYTKSEGAELVSAMTMMGWKRQVEVLGRNFITPDHRSYDVDRLVARGKTFMKYSKKILAGTDTPLTALTPGISLQNELISYVEVFGMEPFDALACGTLNPCRHFGIENSKGSIAEDYDADIVILDDNPIEDIRNIKRISAVITGGSVFDAERLAAIKNKATVEKNKQYELYMKI
jgi:imidazolonepropionase-like amidohydrolase